MKIKTYGVPELTEWHGKVKTGSIEVSVSFTGGTSSPSGAQPAYLVTKDPITQFVIENSKEFRNGFIILLMSQDIPGNHPRMAVPKKNIKHANDGNPVKPSKKVDEFPKEVVNNDTRDIAKVEVSCLQDAQAYLQDKFGIPSYKVRSYEAAQQSASEHQIQFVGAKFDTLKGGDEVEEETTEAEE